MEKEVAVEKKNDFVKLVESLERDFPKLIINVDGPSSSRDGSWWLDVQIVARPVVVTWLPEKGFGFFKVDAAYGENPNRTTHDLEQAIFWLEQSIEAALLLAPPAL